MNTDNTPAPDPYLNKRSHMPISLDTSRNDLSKAVFDLSWGAAEWRMWVLQGWVEIRRRYRRTTLGPFWQTLSMAIFIGSLGVVWAELWNMDVGKYLPYLTAGLLPWTFTSSIIGGSTQIFLIAGGVMRQVRLPYSLFVYRMIWENLITFAHHLVVYAIVMIFFSIPFNANSLLFFVGIILVCFNAIWIGVVLGTLGARYRDTSQLIGSILQVAIFVTPILWEPSRLGTSDKAWLAVNLNPFYHFVEVLRGPMLGYAPAPATYIAMIGMAIIGSILALLVLKKWRSEIIFWV